MRQTVAARTTGQPSLWSLRLGVTILCLFIWRLLATLPLLIGSTAEAGQLLHPITGPLAILTGTPNENQSVVAMGLEPFLDALVIFWLFGTVYRHARRSRNNPVQMWRYLLPLAAVLAFFRAIGLVTLLAHAQGIAPNSLAAVASVFLLVAGSMGLIMMGRVIDRFGVPAGYGVWLLFGIDGLLKGLHALGSFIGRHLFDAQLGAILLGFSLALLLMVGSAVLMVGFISQLDAARPTRDAQINFLRSLPIRLLVGGFILPAVFSAMVLGYIPVILQSLVNQPALIIYWSATSPITALRFTYLAVSCLVVVGACLLSMRISLGQTRNRMLERAVTIAVGLWTALIIVDVPLASEQFLRVYPPLPVGGGRFVVTVAVLIMLASRLRGEIRREFQLPARAAS